MYAKTDLKDRIGAVEQGNLKYRSYYNAFISNKSAIFIRFNIDSSKLVFVGCQLEKGRDGVETRIQNLKEIHDYAFQIEEVGIKKTETILFDDVIFLVGNMNVNISPTFKEDFARFNPDSRGKSQLHLIEKMVATD